MSAPTAPMPSLPARAVITGFLAFLLMGAVQALYGPSLPGLERAFRIGPDTAGLVLSAHNLGAMLGILAGGSLEGRALARWRAGAAVALLGLGMWGLALAPAWPLALLAVLIAGLGYGALTLGLNALFAVAFGARSAAMLNVLNAVFGVGSVLGPLLVAFTAGVNVRLPFLIVAGVGALLLPFALGLDDRVPSVAGQKRARAGHLLVGFVLLLALAVGLEGSSVGWSATYLVSLGNAPALAAGFTSLFYVVFTAGRFVAAALSLRFGPPHLVAVFLALACAFLGLALFPTLAPAALALLGGALAGVFPGIFLWLSGALPGLRGGTAVVLAGALLGGAIFPAVIGHFVGRSGPEVIPAALLVLAVLTLATALALLSRAARPATVDS